MTGPTPQYLENLIASQKAEIDRLTRERTLQDKVVADCVERITERDAEIARLRRFCPSPSTPTTTITAKSIEQLRVKIEELNDECTQSMDTIARERERAELAEKECERLRFYLRANLVTAEQIIGDPVRFSGK